MSRRVPLRARFHSLAGQIQERIARSTGLEGEAGGAVAESARELGAAARRPWQVRATRQSVVAATVRGLDRMAGVVISAPAPIDDLDTLDQYASRTRHGVTAALAAVQATLAAGTVGTEGAGGPPSVVLDAGAAQVASVLTGLAEWYFLGSFASRLMRRKGIAVDPDHLRRIVNAAMLSRGETVDPRHLEPRAEGRLILRWVGRGVLDIVPLVSGFPTQRVRRAGERLQRTDLAAITAGLRITTA